ncbi:hypothetical protein THAOC_25301 [Thalassiosira oceanica]|uniref:Uncharacterized protein n=1 Tax=Thalassiosira oceanica TaxID=159749 RepID=K0RPG6_THAOC|nr:hypothetical protein THAOC_25301 [Thalassiosira oceanica]|eukprot:EJK55015.1 hypothetical protein THAOC_25301 [Thalassiosira oceanica]
MLVSDLCYLASVESEDGTSCLRLSLGCYGEYGRHVIRRHGLSGEVGGWHAALAGALSAALEEGDGDGPAVEVRRYAVQSLPRHTAAGIAGVVDDAGEDRLAIDPSGGGPDVRSRLFEELLCDRSFIRSRLRLLDAAGGRAGRRGRQEPAPGDALAHT